MCKMTRRKISTRRDYRLWFYRTKFGEDFDEFLDEHGGIDEIIADQMSQYQDDIEGLIREWVKTRFILYDAYVGDPNHYKSDEFYWVIKERISIIDDITSHYAMKLISAVSPSIADTIINKETLLFIKMLELSKRLQKSNIGSVFLVTEQGHVQYEDIYKYLFHGLFGDDFDAESLHFTYKKDFKGNIESVSNGSVKIFWKRVGRIAEKWESYTLKNGMIEVPFDNFLDVVAYGVRNLFQQSFKEYKESIQDEFLEPYRPIINDMFAEMIDSQEFTTDCEDIDEIMEESPLCIQEIDRSIQLGESISYHYALQLSLYIKQFFDVDGLANYWWKRDARNRTYASLEDFKSSRRDLMYHFQHQYGYGGTSTDYKPMSCRACRSTGRSCFFQSHPNEVERKLRRKYQDEYSGELVKLQRIIKKIKIFVRNRKYWMACVFELTLRLHIDYGELVKWQRRSINHPLYHYYQTAHKIKNGEEPPKERPTLSAHD